MKIYTVGHSNRTLAEFEELPQTHHIQQLADVRTIPKSRHNPQFNKEALAESLAKAGVSYLHLPGLGGLRQAKSDSINLAWENKSFRGYADYMQTKEFWDALDQLIDLAKSNPTAIMCAEALPWRCHRSLIADALVGLHHVEVCHIMNKQKCDEHKLNSMAKVKDGRLIYPGNQNQLPFNNG